ncbi:N-6 DNA methylase [Bengtsoniella intestinalis]|uniref:N-6 DNA methylase n=1 Tax=Bengtsoniella intestinalis TaxID=3073143 RepID=UPI00391F0CEF
MPRNQHTDKKEFQTLFAGLCQTRHVWRAWSDFIEVSAISIANTLDHGDVNLQREQRYLEIMKDYTSDEQALFPPLFHAMVGALEADPEQDFLGAQFMELQLGNHWKGQFFTPYCVCRLMAQLEAGGAQQQVLEKGYFTINDCCCGAGALLIAARNVFQEQSLGHTSVFYVAQDIDRTAGLMCYIQLSLLGCAGYVVIADALLNPVVGDPLAPAFTESHDVWYMPMFFDPVWQERIVWKQLDRLFRRQLPKKT